MQKKTKPVRNIHELRLKMTEKMAEFEDKDISATEAKAYIGFGTVILNTVKVEAISNQLRGEVNQIDFLLHENDNKSISLKSEILKP